MKRKAITHFLGGALRDGSLVRMKREWDSHAWGGFVIGLSKNWVLIQEVDIDTLRLNGYEAVRVHDINTVKADTSFVTRALEARGENPITQPDILLLDTPGLLSSIDAHFPLMTVYQEGLDAGTRHMGRVSKVGKRRVTLDEITTQAQWEGQNKYVMEDVTRVTFGDGYTNALWMLGKDEWLHTSASTDSFEED